MSDKNTGDVTLERIKQLKGSDSQEVFAKKIKTSQSNVSKMLTGTPPSAATLKALAEEYKVSVDWLLGLSDKKECACEVKSHNLTVDNITYADVMAVLDALYRKGSIEVGVDYNGYNGEPDPTQIIFKDRVLKYFADNRYRFYGGSMDIYNIWIKQAIEYYSNQPIIEWTQLVDTLYEQNVPTPTSDAAIVKVLDDIANGRLKELTLADLLDDELPFK